MFHYLHYMRNKHDIQYWRNIGVSAGPRKGLSIDEHIDPNFLDALKNSYETAKKRNLKLKPRNIKNKCMQIHSQLSDLTSIRLTELINIIALATGFYNLGIIYKDCQEIKDLQLSLNALSRSCKLLYGHELNCTAIFVAVKTLIAMSEIQEQIQTEKTERWLNEAIKLCLIYFEQNSHFNPLYTYVGDVREKHPGWLLIRTYRDIIGLIEKVYSTTGKMDNCIKTVHEFLNHRAGVINTQEEACKWCNATIEISRYLTNNLRYTEARNSLAAAKYMIGRIEGDLSVAARANNDNIVMNLKATVIVAWLQYTAAIFKMSSSCLQAEQQASSVPNQEEPQELLLFTSLSEHLEYINNKITDSFVSNLLDAEKVFSFALEQFRLARNIFVKIGNDIHHLEAVFHFTLLFKFYASLTTNTDILIEIHKSQTMMLQSIYNEYEQRTSYVSEVKVLLVDILKMWKDAAEAFLFVIAKNRLYHDLYIPTNEELYYISKLLNSLSTD